MPLSTFLAHAGTWPHALQLIAQNLVAASPDEAEMRSVGAFLLNAAEATGHLREVGRALLDVPCGETDLWTALYFEPIDREIARLDRVLPVKRHAHPAAIHGTPITPRARLQEMRGASFCVSYFAPEQLEPCIELLGADSTLLLDNGGYSAWTQGLKLDEAYWQRYWAWARAILDRVDQAIAIIPDVIDGDAQANLAHIDEARFSIEGWDHRLMPVWHLHEPLEQLARIVEMGFRWIAFGSSGQFATVGTANWDARVDEAFATIERVCGELDDLHPRVHMLRGLGQMARYRHPFATADSTNIARNHSTRAKAGEPIAAFRSRIERHRFPVPARPMWPHSQVELNAPAITGVQAQLFAAKALIHNEGVLERAVA